MLQGRCRAVEWISSSNDVLLAQSVVRVGKDVDDDNKQFVIGLSPTLWNDVGVCFLLMSTWKKCVVSICLFYNSVQYSLLFSIFLLCLFLRD